MDHFPSLLIVLPLIMSFVTFLLGFLKKGLSYFFSIFCVFSCCFISLVLCFRVFESSKELHYFIGGWNPPFGIEYVLDHLNSPILFFISLSSFLILLHFRTLIEREIKERERKEFFALFLLEITGLLGITATADLFNLYVLLEIASFSAYILCAKGEENAPFFSFRYMIFGTVGACMYLLGVGYIYSITGSLNILDLKALLPKLYGSKALFAGVSFLVSGIAIKMALFPLHLWLPDVYVNAPKIVSTLLASLSTKVLSYVLIRILFFLFGPPFFKNYPSLLILLGYLSSFSMIFFGIMVVLQRDLFRMGCYILLSDIAYIALGLSMGSKFGLMGSLFCIFNDIFIMGLFFSLVSSIFFRIGSRNIQDLRGAQKISPYAFAIFFLLSLSLIGIPPFSGFFGKYFLILGAIEEKSWVFLSAILVSTGLNAIALFRVIEYSYFEEKRKIDSEKFSKSEILSLSFFSLVIIILGIKSGFVVKKILLPIVEKVFVP